MVTAADQPLDSAASHKRNRPGLQFLLALERIENTVRKVADPTSSTGLPAFLGTVRAAKENPEDSWRKNLSTYEELLEKRLARWETLEPGAVEFYRTKIENLRPMLESAIEDRMMAIAAARGVPPPTANLDPALASERPGPSGAPASSMPASGAAAARGLRALDPEPLGAGPSGVGSKNEPSQATRSAASDSKSGNPWRRTGSSVSTASRQALESEMLGIGQGMLGTVTTIRSTVRKDNEVLGKMSDDMLGRLDKVTATTATGKNMMRSGQLGFMCTMAMLITSVIIFFMMIPFIIFT